MCRSAGWNPRRFPSDLVLCAEERKPRRFRAAHFCHAHGLAPLCGWASGKPITATPSDLSTTLFRHLPKTQICRNWSHWRKAVLDARAAHPDATLAELYDPDLMPPNLRRAHQRLDRAVDRLYRVNGFSSERERVEHLFFLYEKLRAPLAAKMRGKPKRRRTRRKLIQ